MGLQKRLFKSVGCVLRLCVDILSVCAIAETLYFESAGVCAEFVGGYICPPGLCVPPEVFPFPEAMLVSLNCSSSC